MVRRLIMLLAAAALFTGCTPGGGGGGGGGSSATGDAAKLVPGDALAFLAIDTDFSSTQLENASAIVDKFPIKDKAIAAITKGLKQEGADLDSIVLSIGGELDVAALTVNGKTVPVGFAQPSDVSRFEQQFAKSSSPPVFEQISGYTVFAESQATLDAVKNRSSNLADSQAYKDAVASLPGDALAKAYVAPAALSKLKTAATSGTSVPFDTSSVQWIAGSLTATDSAFKLQVNVKGVGASASQASSTLVGQIPSGALVALSVVGAGRYADVGTKALQQAQSMLGIDLQGLLAALGDAAIAYVKPGLPLPEVTIASKSADSEQGLAAVDALISKFVPPAKQSTVTSGGVTLRAYDAGPVTIYTGRSGDEIVVSDDQGAIGELTGSGPKLVGDSLFKETKDGAGLPDPAEGFLFVDVKDGLPAAEAIAQLAGKTVPQELDANLKPLRALMVYGSHDGDQQTFVVYLSTS